MHKPLVDAVRGDTGDPRPLDATSFIDRENPEANPVYFLGQTRFDVEKDYVREQFFHLVGALEAAGCSFLINMPIDKGHRYVWEPAQAFGLFWEHKAVIADKVLWT